MKTRPPTVHPSLGFTLIELITVIAIIAILMGLLFPVIISARDSTRKAKASTVTKSVVNACKSYSTDYGKYPPIAEALSESSGGNSYYSYGDTEIAKCKVPNNQLCDVLRAISRGSNADNALNLRKQSYLEQNVAIDPKNPRDGFVDGKQFADQLQGQLLDPWGKQYCIVLDADQDGILQLSPFFQDLTDPVRQSAAVFSMGKDSRIGSQGHEGKLRKEGSGGPAEDIISWE